jgi:hypothetical protein
VSDTEQRHDPLMLEEYKTCKQQIVEDIKWMDQLEIYTVGAVAAVYVFAFSQTKPLLVELLSLIPPFILLAGALRTAALDSTIGVLNDYIVNIEDKNPQIGFTRFYRDNRSFVMKGSRYLVWATLLLLTIGFEILVLRNGPFWTKGL